IFYRFLKPRAIYHATPLPHIDRIITWLCKNTAEEQVLQLFNTSHPITYHPDYASASAEIQSILSSHALTAPTLVQSAFLDITHSYEGADALRVSDSDDDTLEYLEQQLKLHGLADDPESP
ncbi:MAG: hypothetical protein K2X53_02310, partial [Alphaproteobacteria bacterium]|nr:hypothetical protein [Alphaproteobacteria bacterium]